jgi:hypothetical protein
MMSPAHANSALGRDQRSSRKKAKHQRKGKMESQDQRSSDPVIMAAMTEFKTHSYNRQSAAKTLLPLLKPDMSIQAIEEILGSPDYRFWSYGLFYSSTLIVCFDRSNKVTEVSSDLLSEISRVQGREKELTDPEVVAAVSQFKAQPYNRQSAAKILLPLIKVGMSIEEVETMLGPPGGRVWQYSLSINSDAALTVHFNHESKVERVSLG